MLRPRERLGAGEWLLAAVCTHQVQPIGNADNGFNLIFPL